ncbi:AraC family transcriptional regulator [Azospirillum baldaniorum]|uniref:Transcriptional regulator, AraC family n=1 Tax=Azospirillum baldaniorum TaxID=1064539 RepID=A0A9P1NKE5_9PROT|nr:AraC family transcriptional regulator [Azospirillum baldaniorum]AWJ88644.1 AraC family transcriptional regulator [Azospirillum baldaniorum]NUB06578.1 AraC family transcriptional regulator [Azospirillum baldaniorum]TWA79821.1 AraC family transcriptional regulator [Azospirillum brasilense]CCC96387.1 putative transcriptional regulator, AraC family [Azospirillum baldaniorum]
MTKPDTLLDYGRRIERVIDHIAAHLDETLELERLAAVACFSPYHFHRIYRAMAGETAADTLRRLRLHRAAGDLVKGGDGMVQVARRAGYGSVEAFTRAFGQVYGLSPGAYRRQGRLVPPSDQPPDEERSMHDVTIRDLPPLRVAAMAHQGPYMNIGTTFERLYAWAAGRGLVGPETRSFALYYDDPESVPADQLRSEAALLLDGPIPEDGAVHPLEIAGGRHAVLIHKGPYAELERPYRWLYRDWLPSSGHTPADRPCVEEYLNNPRTLPPEEWLTEIRLPLA